MGGVELQPSTGGQPKQNDSVLARLGRGNRDLITKQVINRNVKYVGYSKYKLCRRRFSPSFQVTDIRLASKAAFPRKVELTKVL